jgi:hypothetical protein
VEGKVPFYQLNNLYVYELRCEIFRYEDELIDTSIDEVDKSIQDFGYIQTITMVGDTASRATATVSIASTLNRSVQYIDLINDGTGYLSTPIIQISKAPEDGIDATAVAIMTSKTGIHKCHQLQLWDNLVLVQLLLLFLLLELWEL